MTAAPVSPPGPKGHLWVGSMFDYKGPNTNLEWTEQYGPIYSVRMGCKKLVYLNTIELVEKYMEGPKGEQFLERPMGPAGFGEGLVFGSGDIWKRNRRVFMKAIHTKNQLKQTEGAVQSELMTVLDDLHRKVAKGSPTRLGKILLPACANVLSRFILGESLPRCPDQEILHTIVKKLEGIDLTSPLLHVVLRHPKICKHLQNLLCGDVADIYSTSRRLQRLIGLWIHQTRYGLKAAIQAAFYHHSPHHTICPCALCTLDKPSRLGESKYPNKEHPLVHAPTIRISPPEMESDSMDIHHPVRKCSSMDTVCPHSTETSEKAAECWLSDNVLQKQEEAKKVMPLCPDLKRKFISTDSVLSLRNESEDLIDDIENQVLEFLPDNTNNKVMKPVALPVLPTENRRRHSTGQADLERHLSLDMLISDKYDCVLRRILTNPEFSTAEGDKELLQSLVDMFFGGVTTVVSGLEFILMYLSKNPHVQMLAYEEIDRVLAEEVKSRGGEPNNTRCEVKITWSMREKMPYLRACLVEGLRLGRVFPSSMPHVATVDTEIQGYTVPKGTFVLASIYSLHRDPKEYLDPKEYRPQRHLDAQGKFCPPRGYRPYGIGKRRCLGECLAEMELFIFTAAILREFSVISSSDNEVALEMETRMRISHRLKKFKCILKCRRDENED